jgi:serine/threonine protein kinase/tetratricopeptide (TPR) repeat protein
MSNQLSTSVIAGRFRRGEMIGRGGMGEVFRGLDQQTQEPVAIKALKSEVVMRDPGIVERFNREGEALRQLNHPNIVKVLATVEEAGNHYIIMELVDGGTLSDLIRESSQLPIQQVLSIALELTDALTRAHHLKIIHRDIKPANVLLASDGTPRLTDFGVARIGEGSEITRAGSLVGTFAYLSPEACRGDVLDVRSDIWSFGVMLYEMLAGIRPFMENQAGALVHAILTQPIPDLEKLRSDIPTSLLDLVYRMLEKNREARIPRMRMVGAELEAIIDGLDSQIRTTRAMVVASERSVFDSPMTVDLGNITPPSHIEYPRNLPAFTTPFIGRDQELREITALLDKPSERLITILGPGGIGKTRLAIAATEQRLRNFTDGVFYVPLAPISDSSFLPTTIAEHIRFTFSGAADPKTELLDFLREKHMLLILDNFEHLIDSAGIVSDILSAAPQVKVIVSSRERLRLRGEKVFDVQGMVTPEGDSSEQIRGCPAVQLFVQNARRIQPDFELNEDTAPHVANICRRVEGMPLGIELAAGWLEALPLEEVVSEIDQSLDFLETDLRDVPERHRSLRAVFESSWELISDDERHILMKLSVFRGGFSRDAAQKVTGASLRNLTSLVNKSFLKRAADGRYTPHILLRQFAEEIFEDYEDERQEVQQAHAQYYAHFLDKLKDRFNSKRERKAIDEMELELENIRVAWRRCVDKQQWDTLNEMLHPVHLFYIARSMLSEATAAYRELAEAMKNAAQDSADLYWRTLVRQGLIMSRLGGYEQSAELGKAAFDYFQVRENDLEASFALNVLCYVDMMQGRYEAAKTYGADALRLAEKTDDKEACLLSMGNLGYVVYLIGDYAEAQRIHNDFIRISAEEGSPISQAFGLNNLGEIMNATGRPDEAQRLYEEAYEIFRTYKHRRGQAFTLNNLGGIYFTLGKFKESRQSYEEARRLYKDIGDRAGNGHSLSSLGNVAFYSGEFEQAQNYYQQSLRIRRENGDQRGIADSLNDLADTALAMDKFDEARRLFDESLQIRRDIRDQTGIARSLVGLGLVTLAERTSAELARSYFQEALSLVRENIPPWLQAWALSGMGEVEFLNGNLNAAETHFHEALKIARDIQFASAQVFALAGLATINRARGESRRALELVTAALRQESPVIYSIIQQRAVQLVGQLENELPAEVFAEVQHDLSNTAVDVVIAEILQNRPSNA